MPLFLLHCPSCTHKFDVFHAMSADHPACPRCGQPTETDHARQGAPAMNRTELHGRATLSHEIQMQPHEVPKVRKLFGAAGNAIQNDGTVRFNHMQEAKDYFAREQQVRAMFRQQKADGTLKTKKKRRAP